MASVQRLFPLCHIYTLMRSHRLSEVTLPASLPRPVHPQNNNLRWLASGPGVKKSFFKKSSSDRFPNGQRLAPNASRVPPHACPKWSPRVEWPHRLSLSKGRRIAMWNSDIRLYQKEVGIWICG